MFTILLSAIEGLSFIMGPIFGASLRINPFDLKELERYAAYILCIISWSALLRLAGLYLTGIPENGSSTKNKGALVFGLGLFAFTLITLGLVQVVQVKSAKIVFHLFIITLLLQLLSKVASNRNSIILRLGSQMLFVLFATAVSFHIISQEVYWQPYIVGLSFAFMVAAPNLLSIVLLSDKDRLPNMIKKNDFLSARKFYTGFLFGGPFLLIFLCITYQLPKIYLLCLVPTILAKKLPDRLTKLCIGYSQNSSPHIALEAKQLIMLNNLLISGLLVLVALLSAFS